MDLPSRESRGPTSKRTALADEIADALATSGAYRADVEASASQRLIDLQWNAYRAGKILGAKVKVSVEQCWRDLDPGRSGTKFLTVTVTRRQGDFRQRRPQLHLHQGRP